MPELAHAQYYRSVPGRLIDVGGLRVAIASA
jgi:hypothetical protein